MMQDMQAAEPFSRPYKERCVPAICWICVLPQISGNYNKLIEASTMLISKNVIARSTGITRRNP